MEASALSHPVGLGRLSVSGPLLRLRGDDQLVALFRAGHDEAFGVIHDRYRQRLLAYARQMLGGSRPDAEDVLQDVFLRAYHALRADARDVTLRAWLYRVAHNRCIDHLRRPSPAAEDIFDLNRVPQHDPATAAERREDLRRLVEDVGRLPEQQRSALLMREMEGLSYRELADALGVTIPAIKSLLVRARIGLVEAVEARDTACKEIRVDLAATFDRGVRASGRSRRHLRECAGCRDYRTALRGVERRLNGLTPGAGPLATVAKLLGLGGAGSGAGAVTAVGGGGGAAAVGGGAATVSVTKVVAAVAAAAVVGGGAATVEQQVVQKAAPHRAAVHRAPPARSPLGAGPTAAAAAQRDPEVHLALARTAPLTDQHVGGTRRIVATLSGDGAPLSSSSTLDQPAPPYESTTGGLQAPDAPAEPTTHGTGSGATTGATTGTGSGTGPAGATGSTTTGSTAGAGPQTTAPPAAGSGAGSTATGPGGGAPGSGTGATAGPAGPSGQVSNGSTPTAQGASAPPADR